ncbi:ICP22 family protein [Paenibacillus senegalensis]|uniref:hypothetical protein n=1 Tax=Paenibacillus senegalensis TaxID=1465766 RepID=UPI0011DC8716|nr:hypothetical protein [Paenibacillus senegalensis]
MQRHLDSDLEEQEEDLLLGHIRDCPDCAAMYERLIRLSEDLTALPSVSPPVNIVDSIMPRLDGLAFPASDKPSVQAVAPSIIKDQNESEMSAPLRRPRKKYIWTALSGVAAAGLAIGLFIFDLDGPVTRHAELKDSHAPETSSSMVQDKNTAPDGNEAGAAADGDPESAGEPMGSILEESGELAETATDGEASLLERNLTEDPGPPTGDGEVQPEELQVRDQAGPAAGDAVAEEIHKEQVPPEPEQPVTEMAPNEDTPVTEAGEVPQTEEAEAPESSPEDQEVGIAAGEPVSGAEKQESGSETPADLSDPQYRSPEVVYERLLSPGNDLFAYVNEQRVLISSSDGEVRFASQYKWQPEDKVRFVAWLNEQELLYQVTKESGETIQYKVDVKEQTETEIAY